VLAAEHLRAFDEEERLARVGAPDCRVDIVVETPGLHLGRWEPERFRVNGAQRSVAKRAQEFIEEHYWDSVRLEDLCRVTGVGIRTLQRSFREYFDLTISEYLKALRHGFGHLGRFSLEFRDRFGESPREAS
jgi:AraC-like DNA-binding protein